MIRGGFIGARHGSVPETRDFKFPRPPLKVRDVNSFHEMEVLPPRTVPQTPVGPMKLTLGVEESRAQRHQRQQSRFRDRGGIFKPSNRNTLVDILMGRRAPSPGKSVRRSPSRSPSKRSRTPSRPGNDLGVSPTKTKTPRKTRSLVPPEASLEENGMVHLRESEAQETSTVAQPTTKRRGRPPKQLKTSGDVNEPAKSGTKSKRKTSKSESAPKRKRTGSQKAKSTPAKKSKQVAGTSDAQAKPLSRLSTIAEEAERSEFSEDERSRAANMKAKRNQAAAVSRASKDACPVDEGAPIVRDEKKGTRTPDSRPAMTETLKKKPSSNKATPARSVLSIPPGAPAPAGHQANESIGSKTVTPDSYETTTHSDKLADGNGIPLKEGGSSRPASRRKCQNTGSHDVEVENQGHGAKRVKPGVGGGKASEQDEYVVNACQDIKSVAKITNAKRREVKVKQVSSATDIPLEMSGARSKKRVRNPEDSLLTLSPSKRFKPGKADAGPEADKSLCERSAKSGKSQAMNRGADSEVTRQRKLKENNTTSKKPPKSVAQGSKPKTSNKRGKGLPRRVLQRLKDSEPHLVDDEPDPIDFLS